MMENQRIFEEAYCLDLRRQIRNENYAGFREADYDYDKDRVMVCNYIRPEGLLEKMLAFPTSDLFHPAKELYEAYEDLSGLQATYDPFWIYLSLVDLYQYVIRQYPHPEEYKSQYALNHFFMSKNTAYNLRGLWWAIKMTIRRDANGNKDYSRAEFFLNEHSQLTQSMSESQLFRCEEVTRGVVEYFYEHKEDCNRDTINEALKYLNMLGSIKQLACLQSNYITQLLEERIPIIKASSDQQNNKTTLQRIVSLIKGT